MPGDTQLLHSGLQRRAPQPHPRGGAVAPADYSTGEAQGVKDSARAPGGLRCA